jgi:hypothetical protein
MDATASRRNYELESNDERSLFKTLRLVTAGRRDRRSCRRDVQARDVLLQLACAAWLLLSSSLLLACDR